MAHGRTVKLVLPEAALTVVRESIDHHVKALVWRINQMDNPDDLVHYMHKTNRLQDEIDECNRTLDLIEKQMQQQH